MELTIREILPEEYQLLGNLMVEIYKNLPGFPSPEEQPKYYEMLSTIGELNERDNTSVLVAIPANQMIVGGVVYISDMAQYGSGGTATKVKNASGIRLLGVDKTYRGKGIGKALTFACIDRATEQGHKKVVLHTTASMKAAWRLYESIGFKRADDLDFMQEKLQVFGFRLNLV